MKPLMGQAQNQLNLDDLFSSSKAVAGNFSRPNGKTATLDDPGSRKPSFSEVLLKNLEQKRDTPKQKADRPETKTLFTPHNEGSARANVMGKKTEIPSSRGSFSDNTPNQATSSRKEPQDSTHLADQLSRNLQTQAPTSTQATEQSASQSAEKSNRSNNEASGANQVDPALIPLQKQFGKKLTTETIINNNAILSFITGRLDRLELDTLPSLLTDSALIKQVLSSDDVANFLESPTSINELSNLLELDQKLMAGAARDGLNPSEFVKPKDFIQALGIDPNKVASELAILKQTLPNEGIAAYIDRAQALSAFKQQGELAPQVPAAQASVLSQKEMGNVGRALSNSTSNLENSKVGNPEQSMAAAVTGSTLAQITQNSSINLSSNKNVSAQTSASDMVARASFKPTNYAAPSVLLADPNPVTTTRDSSDVSHIDALLADLVGPQSEAEATTTQSQENELLQAFRAGINPMAAGLRGSQQTGAPISAANPKEELTVEDLASDFDHSTDLTKTSVDPFAAMSHELDSSTSTKIEFSGNGVHNRSLEEILIDRNAGQTISTSQLDKKEESSIESLLDVPAELNIENFENKNLDVGLASDVDTFVSEARSNIGLSGSGHGSGEGSESGSFQGNSENQPQNLMGDKSISLRDSKVNFTNKLSTDSATPAKESLAQKILGQAEIMFKNGGGSMRMDVEAPGIGKVDVAINLNNNQLDVRIITASDQARDIISREVAGLRDGLTQQGLSLRGLEVGKASESSSRQFAGQGNQHFGQGAQDQKATYNDMKEYVQSFRNSYAPRNTDRLIPTTPSFGRWNNLAANSGSRLEVRV